MSERHWYRLVVNEKLGFIIVWLTDEEAAKYERVLIKICGNWYPALRRVK